MELPEIGQAKALLLNNFLTLDKTGNTILLAPYQAVVLGMNG